MQGDFLSNIEGDLYFIKNTTQSLSSTSQWIDKYTSSPLMFPVSFEQQQINTKEREVNALSEVLGSIVARKLLRDNAPKSFFIIDQTYISVVSKKIPNLSHSNKNDLLYTDIERVMVLDYLISHGDSDNPGNTVYIEKNGVRHVSLIDYSMAFDTIQYRSNIPIKSGGISIS